VTPDTILILCPADEEMLYPAVRKRWQEEMAGRDGRKRWLVEVREAALHQA
jgi:hypothetical protein